MQILITGGGGFLGARLARTLLAQGSLSLRGAAAQPIKRITLTDISAPPADLLADPRVSSVTGDLLDLLEAKALPAPDTAAVFHLAAAVSAECEANFDLGMRSNLATTQALLQACRALGTQPVFVNVSSMAVFGLRAGESWRGAIDDDTLPTPQGSYGIQKYIGEQLVADFTRKGFIAGRSVRPATVCVRPGRPNGAASGFFSGMVREPLAGLRAPVPVGRELPVALASPTSTVQGFIRAAEASDADWGPLTGINLTSLRTTVGGMVDGLEAIAGREATALLDWVSDPAVERLVRSWPGDVGASRARGLGLVADPDFASIVRAYARENPQAIRIPLKD